MIEDQLHLAQFLKGKPQCSVELFYYFKNLYATIAPDVVFIPAKTMIGVAKNKRRIAWVTQFGKNFLHVVLLFGNRTRKICVFKKYLEYLATPSITIITGCFINKT